ncbi:tRNA1(Val) (adenine(37)-N6)-methyltransferase [Patiriisocius hiemis]
MKIGTDGVLLGAWTPIAKHTDSILDIGAGTGVISLQMAQRCGAQTIDAIEIDDLAHEQCTQNFEASPWTDRLFCYHASVQEFASEIDEKYTLIISNPPFYRDTFKTESLSRDTARFEDALPFKHLLVCASHLLEDDGCFSVIIPKKEEDHFIQLASESNLYPLKICRVKGRPSAEIKRSMILFSFKKQAPQIETLVIETERHQYTTEYQKIVSNFYLKM